MIAEPVLSVLIPAYAYRQGLLRILDRLPLGSSEIEVLVHDDSPDDGIAGEFAAGRHGGVVYCRNRPALGAAANWNGLLDAARGRYVLLIHHDEVPDRSDFVPRLLAVLGRNGGGPDLVLLGLRLGVARSKWTRKLVPDALRGWLAVRHPAYLLTRNFLGPTACLVLRRDRAPRFDPDLKWLVDVDFYLKALAGPKTLVCARGLSVISETGREDSITRALAPVLAETAAEERRILVSRHVAAGSARTGPDSPHLRTRVVVPGAPCRSALDLPSVDGGGAAMNIVAMIGGLGNQMYQFSLGTVLAATSGEPVRYAIDMLDVYHDRQLEIEHLGIAFERASATDIRACLGAFRTGPQVRRLLASRRGRPFAGPRFVTDSGGDILADIEATGSRQVPLFSRLLAGCPRCRARRRAVLVALPVPRHRRSGGKGLAGAHRSQPQPGRRSCSPW